MLDKKGYAGAILMDLSKPFDTVNHEPLVAKPNANGISKEALKLLSSHLNNRKQRVKISKTLISWKELLCSVTQGSELEPIFLNIYLNNRFFFQTK